MKIWFVRLILELCWAAAAADPTMILGIIGEQVSLPCHFDVSRQQGVSQLRVLWQIAGHRLVHAQYGESEFVTSQAARYRNRTRVPVDRMESGDMSLQLDAVTLEDGGLYECLVLVPSSKGHHKEQETTVTLVTAAHFNTPKISGPSPEFIRVGQEVTLTCSSSAGYPDPIVNWTSAGGNPLPIGSHVNTSAQSDPSSGLWNVTSVLRVNVTSNSTFLCSIFNRRTREGKTADWKYFKKPGPLYRPLTLILLIVLPVIALILIVGLLLYKKRRTHTRYSVTDGIANHLEPLPSGPRSDELEEFKQSEDCV
ncbi:programmed cell death 1 ligand 1-like [Mustelus asterias]